MKTSGTFSPPPHFGLIFQKMLFHLIVAMLVINKNKYIVSVLKVHFIYANAITTLFQHTINSKLTDEKF